MSDPDLSVVIPVYDAAGFVEERLRHLHGFLDGRLGVSRGLVRPVGWMLGCQTSRSVTKRVWGAYESKAAPGVKSRSWRHSDGLANTVPTDDLRVMPQSDRCCNRAMARPVVGVQALACHPQPKGCTPADNSTRPRHIGLVTLGGGNVENGLQDVFHGLQRGFAS